MAVMGHWAIENPPAGEQVVKRNVRATTADGVIVGGEVKVVSAEQLRGAVEALRRIAAGHAHPSKLAGEALDALPPDDNVYDPPYFERGQ